MAAPAATAPVSEAAPQVKSKASATKKPKTPKAVPAHPTYLQMSAEAIGALKDRTGSSQVAIAKWVEEKYKGTLPSNFKKQLSVQLKKLSQKGKLVQIKHSYKLSDELKKPAKPAVAKTAVKKKPIVKKAVKSPKLVKKTAPKSGAAKVVKPKSVKSVKPAKPAVKPAAKTAAKPAAKPATGTASKKVVKKAAPAAKKVVKKVAPAAKKPVAVKKVAPKKPKSAKKAVKPKAAPAKKAKTAA